MNKPFMELLGYFHMIVLLDYYRRYLPCVISAFSSSEMSLRRRLSNEYDN